MGGGCGLHTPYILVDILIDVVVVGIVVDGRSTSSRSTSSSSITDILIVAVDIVTLVNAVVSNADGHLLRVPVAGFGTEWERDKLLASSIVPSRK